MSKAIGLALAITEVAQASYEVTKTPGLNIEIWNKIIESSSFQNLVYRNITPAKNWLGVPDPGSMPTMQDFTDLKVEFSKRLDFFAGWPSVRALFMMLEAEATMEGRVPEGFFSEILYDFVLEDCQAYLNGNL